MTTKTIVIECSPEEWASHCTDYFGTASLEEMALGYAAEKSNHADECTDADSLDLANAGDPIKISDAGKVQIEVVLGNEDEESDADRLIGEEEDEDTDD